MKKVTIKRGNVETHSARFETQGLADEWIAKNSQNKSFGKIERWVPENLISSEGEDVELALEERTVTTPQGSRKEYRFASEFQVTIEDITSQVLAESKIKSRLIKQEIGSIMVAEITEINAGKNLSTEALAIYLADPAALNVERLLRSGSLEYAKGAILSFPGVFYSTAEKQALADKIDALILAKLGTPS